MMHIKEFFKDTHITSFPFIFLESSSNRLEGSFFIGYGFNPDTFISNGLGKTNVPVALLEKITDGRFIVRYENSRGTHIYVDSAGQELLFVYSDRTRWALSNSFLALALYASRKGWSLTLSAPLMASFFMRGSFWDQPISHQTAFHEIRLIDHRKKVLIDNNHQLRITQRAESYQTPSSWEFIEHWRNVIKTVATHIAPDIYIELSGGLDSRVAFALSHSSAPNLSVISNRKKKIDYAIASTIANIYKTPITHHSHLLRNAIEPDLSWKLWLLGNAGIQLGDRKRPPGQMPSPTARVAGGGGEVARIFYHSSPSSLLRKVEKFFPFPHIQDAVVSKLASTFENENIHLNKHTDLIRHYINYRNRYFSGRAWYKSLFGFQLTPFQTGTFHSLSYKLTDDDVKQAMLHFRLLNQTAPALLYFVFDDIHKSWPNNLLVTQADKNMRPDTLKRSTTCLDFHLASNNKGNQDRNSSESPESKSSLSSASDLITFRELQLIFESKTTSGWQEQLALGQLDEREKFCLINSSILLQLCTKISWYD